VRRKRDSTEVQGGSKWLTTFNDMVTLLLTFFVLILSMSQLDGRKVSEVSRSFREAFGMLWFGDRGAVGVFHPFVIPKGIRAGERERKMYDLAAAIGGISGMDAKVTPEGIRITIDDTFLFETGKAEFIAPMESMGTLGRLLRDADGAVRVEGHTDNVPISTEKYPSNWELSTARAVAVVKYLVSECGIAPERLSAVGYGDSRPRVDNDTERNRALNRRVEIIVSTRK
jgi:chemotaxis protein MotB